MGRCEPLHEVYKNEGLGRFWLRRGLHSRVDKRGPGGPRYSRSGDRRYSRFWRCARWFMR